MSWDELLDRGDQPFNIFFPPVCGVHSSLTLKAVVLHPCDNQDSVLLDMSGISLCVVDTDTGHEQFVTYMASKTVSHLNDAVEHFQLVLDQCLVGHPDRAAALTNLAWARLKGYIQKDLRRDLRAARYGPVIILIASQYSCSAIIVPTSGEPHHVRFPCITLTHLETLRKDFAREIWQASFMHPEEMRKKLQALLQMDVGGNYAWGMSISVLTRQHSALIRSRRMMKTHVTLSFAAIKQGSPGVGQGEALLTIDSELEIVRKLVPTMANPTTLSGDNTTGAGVLDTLQCNTWVHLACHGKQDREPPYNSRFTMRNEPLTLFDIMENDTPHAEFAFLSACHTAVGDEKMPIEVIHLAAGLQFSGFKSVIGTLWVVDDAVMKHVVEAFYEILFSNLEDSGVMDCTKVAWALNRATNAVKTKVPLEQRMVFIHIGV
ncbi:CHAT domain-containing protein [Suillus subalutaceus]|uniref:CHAT domain-containing protein n=1 Tax=Suillus subalutaceus TaxID=48586 RepID=UPI001B8685E9|nr:CHAT domain-containing protein [Suillus subalutaceus]KAG1851075.1 CHAT domain-containing protein [Suillus subalutaceus]